MSQQSQQVFSGRYEILRHLARGGMAEVYLAHDLMLDRQVALKVLFRELSTDRNFVERFRREAQAAANLSHPNIVSVYDWGEEDDTYFIVMEYVEGRTLGQIIRAEGPLLPDRAADIGAEVAAALGFAHRNGVVHRDVKPGNVLISTSGQVKVTDFGIARAANTDQDLTQTGSVMGTATYFSPEQAQGQRVDARSDLYSLGIVLYEMVVGRPPFAGDNPMAIAYKHVRELPVPPRQANPDIPAQFEAIVLQAMAKNPNDRYTSADELRQDLLRFRQGRSVLANPTVMAPAIDATVAVPAADATRAIRRTTTEGPPPPPRRSNWGFALLLLAMLAVLGFLLFLLAKQLGFVGSDKAVRVSVPSVIGKTSDDAKAELNKLGLTVNVDNEVNNTQPVGHVYDQDPKAGGSIDKGASVTIRVAAAPDKVKMPSVVGKSVSDAQDILDAYQLNVKVNQVADPKAPKDQVTAQDPAAGQDVAKGDTVTLTVSTGKPQASVPDVTGLDAADAANQLGQAGFKTKTASEASSTVEKGKVIRTDPAANTQADQGSTVTMFVSSGVAQISVPNVIGKTQAEAKAAIEGAGLVYAEGRPTPVNPDKDGTVVAQNPSGGTMVDRGTTVVVSIGQASITSTTSSATSTSTTR